MLVRVQHGRRFPVRLCTRRSPIATALYSPLVRYKYSVSNRAFTGERICFGLDGMFAGYKFAQRYTQRYPVGSPVAVYYDPEQPSQSVLEPGITKRAFIPMAFGLGFAIFGGWFALTSWLFR